MTYPFAVDDIVSIALTAGREAARIYDAGFTVTQKSDLSPVTQADIACEEIIFTALARLTPDIPVVGEEHVASGKIPVLSSRFFWLVDPIDGTVEFVKKNGEFTVNIALIDDQKPVFGVVYAPVVQKLFFTKTPETAVEKTDGGENVLKTRPVDAAGLDVLCSRSHFNEEKARKILGDISVKNVIRRGSSLKFCEIAAGRGDVYPCTHETHEWDTAAAHAVLKAAGGLLTDIDGDELTYRKKNFKNPPLLACGGREILSLR